MKKMITVSDVMGAEKFKDEVVRALEEIAEMDKGKAGVYLSFKDYLIDMFNLFEKKLDLEGVCDGTVIRE